MYKAAYKLKNRKGFTLVELLIVVAIIGILAAIAIPQFGAYRRRAYNSAATSDLTNIRTTEEVMMAEYQDYGNTRTTAIPGLRQYQDYGSAAINITSSITLVGATSGANQTISLSSGVYTGAKVFPSGGRNVSYTAAAKHTNGDSGYSTETYIQGLYRKPISAGANLLDADIPGATQGIDFASPWDAID